MSTTPRKAMTPKRKAEAFLACGGRCAWCGEKIHGAYEVDHRVSLFMGGSEDVSNLECLHPPCHAEKTHGLDAPARAKVKRLLAKSDPETRKPSKMRSRGFDKGGPKQKIPSRPFRSRPT